MQEKIEFIESYVKYEGGDYVWNDNHGVLVRCGDCHYLEHCYMGRHHEKDWFCADGRRKDGIE